MKTTIDLDHKKLLGVMKLAGLKTRKEAIDYALTQAERLAKLRKVLSESMYVKPTGDVVAGRSMTEVNIHQAKTHLSRLLSRVAAGEEVVIARAGKPIARLVPFHKPKRKRPLGMDRGLFSVPGDFDAPLADDLLAAFESKL